ncbi:uncharacterized protein LOC127244738 [Andrographis paniculata]|uniref:uncharacterized protein LOC127244738 n=1 Tax=Andrographis paniculata TaxID=175694 RepID=UPI0021E8D8FF|nr:uncharacterized protein LOC127244738 [Andrographis paniculata]
MDFHSLSRRELQALCKKNKIPANITNVAMADALKALQIVEGIDDLMHPSKSVTAQSSIESPTRSEVMSPYLPPSAAGSTRWRQSGRSTRRNLVNNNAQSQDNEIGATAAMSTLQSGKKDEVEDEKRDVLMTPAPLGATSRRRRGAEDSTVKRVYSTRRSARLAEKSLKMLNEGNHGVSSSIAKKESTKSGSTNVDMALQKDFDEEITGGGDSSTDSSEISVPYNLEVVSAKKQGVLSDVAYGEVSSSISENVTELYEEKREEAEDICIQNLSAALNLSNEVVESGKDEVEEREHSEAANGSNQEMEVSNEKETGIGLDAEAEQVEKKRDNNTQDPRGESIVMALSSNDEAELGEEVSVNTQDPSGKSIVIELGEEGSDPGELGEEVSVNTQDPSGESIVMPLNSNDEAELGEEVSVNTQDPSGESIVIELGSNDETELGEEVSVNTQEPSGESIVIELGEDVRVDTQDPGVESVVIALSLDDEVIGKEAELGEEGSVKADDLSDEIAAIKHEVQQKLFVEKDMELLNDTYNEEGEKPEGGIAAAAAEPEGFKNIAFENEKDNEIEKERNEDTDVDNAVVKLTELGLQEAAVVATKEGDSDCCTDQLVVDGELNEEDEPKETGIFEHKEESLAADLVPKNEEQQQIMDDDEEEPQKKKSFQIIPPAGSTDTDLITSTTPIKNSASKASNNRQWAVFSDNKENIGSGGKLSTMKEGAKDTTKKKNVNYDEMSVRMLKKMVKEKFKKLSINDSNDENDDSHGQGNHHHDSSKVEMGQAVAPSRSALQPLPENN